MKLIRAFKKFKDGIFQPVEEKKEEDQKVPDLSEEEKLQILSSQKFKHFFDFKSKVMERQLAEEVCCFLLA